MKSGCICSSIADRKLLLNDYVSNGTFTILEDKGEPYLEKVKLKCNKCSAQWTYERDDSYHQPIVNWNRA